MYERSAIVLERYFENIFGFNKENNLKTNCQNYDQIVKIIKDYKNTTEEEEKVISKFDEVATKIEEIQRKQSKLHESNVELEEQRNKLFNDLGENPSTLDEKLEKIEDKIEKNNEELKELRSLYVNAMVLFTERQKERNKHARVRRTVESDYLNQIKNANKSFESIDKIDVKKVQDFIKIENDKIEQSVLTTMTKNGESERVPFSKSVFEKAAEARIEIAKKEAELYINVYAKTKKILTEVENENIRLSKAEKLVKDTGVKLTFLEAEKEYIVLFLDNERMTAINGKKTHEILMEEACKNFDADMKQINNLYELILKETTDKATKKAYNDLYNKNYLRKIEEKEKDFEEEVTNIKVNIGTVINSNYWRIEGIKNIYKVFQEEVTEKFNKDLSEYKIEEIDEEEVLPNPNKILKRKINNNYDEEDEITIDEDEHYYDDYDEIENEDYEDKYDDDYEDEDLEEEDDENDYEDDEDYIDYDEIDEEDNDNYGEIDNDDYEYEDDYDEDFEDDKDDFEDDKNKVDYDQNIRKFFDGYDDNIYGINIDEEEKIIENKNAVNEEEFTEETIDEIIKNSRKRRNRNRSNRSAEYENSSKGLFGKIFKK